MTTELQAPTTIAPAIYKPPGSYTLKEAKPAQIRLGIQGYGGSGKTWAAMTFPNPVVLSTDRGLGAHIGREDIIEIPFYDNSFIKQYFFNAQWTLAQQRKAAITTWLNTEALKLNEQQTLVLDGQTGLQNIWNAYVIDTEPTWLTKQLKIDDYAQWKYKIAWFGEIAESLKRLKCSVVYLSHEVDKKESDGKGGYIWNGKIRPLLTGQFGDELVTHFTDWFRQLSGAKPKPGVEPSPDAIAAWGCKDKTEYLKLMQEEYGHCNACYFWQTVGDDVFDAKASSLINPPRLIPANYKNFIKYTRKQISS